MFPAPVWAEPRTAPARNRPRKRQRTKPQNLRFMRDLRFLPRASHKRDLASGLERATQSLSRESNRGRLRKRGRPRSRLLSYCVVVREAIVTHPRLIALTFQAAYNRGTRPGKRNNRLNADV